VTVLITACRPGVAATPVLTVGDQRGAVASLLKAAGELDHLPYQLKWATFPVGAPLIEAIKAGAVDFGYVGSSTMTFGLVSGSPLRAINVWRFHGPGSGLLVRPGAGIRKVADLRGKRIAVVRGSPAHLLVAQALKNANVPDTAVTYVFLLPGDAKAALSTGAVDAWAIWDPYLAIGEKQDHLSVLLTSEGVTEEVECGVASQQAVATKRAALLDFMARVRRAQAWAAAHPDEAAKVYASETGLPSDIAELVRRRMKVEVLPSITDDAIASHQKGADLFAEIGVIPRRIDVKAVYDRSFVLP
jgi:sulfonate transport system substrate-binding protein